MREPSGRVRAASVVLGTSLLTALGFSSASAHADPSGLDRFLYALAQVESAGNYTARNPSSGAYGKYQIMPFNWPVWAEIYLGNANAKQTPQNQEMVARGKIHDLHGRFRKWRVVAHWWLTGSSSTDEATWSAFSKRYVEKVMTIYHANAPQAQAQTAVIGQSNPRIDYDGRWGSARHPAYSAGVVRSSNQRRATATFEFNGRSVAWIGPRGPTRGQAHVFVDGRYSRTIDLYASGYRARNTIWGQNWRKSGKHTIRIEVVGTRGRPTVAIDELRYVR